LADKPVYSYDNVPGIGPIIRNDQGSGAGAARDFLDLQKSGSEVFSVNSAGLPDPGGGDTTQMLTISVGDLVADSDALVPFLHKFPVGVTITKVSICADTDTADGSTNKQTFTVKRSSDDGQIVAVTTATANPGLTGGTWLDAGSVTNGAIGAAEYLYLTIAKTASGIAISGLQIQVEFTLL